MKLYEMKVKLTDYKSVKWESIVPVPIKAENMIMAIEKTRCLFCTGSKSPVWEIRINEPGCEQGHYIGVESDNTTMMDR